MKRTIAIFGIVIVLLFGSWWFLLRGGSNGVPEVIYRTEKARMGDATLSFNATGVLQPLTIVDVKSKAGGQVVKLAVQEGSVVKAGDLIAEIDPRDVKANYDQVEADLNANLARREQGQKQLEIERVSSEASVNNAEAALASAKLRLSTLEARAGAQPTLTKATIQQAQANYEVAVKALATLEKVTIPQTRAQVEGDLSRTKADLETADANLKRQEELLAKGYVSRAQYEQAKASRAAAAAAYRNAEERIRRIGDDLDLQLQTARDRVTQAKAALDIAQANSIDIRVSKNDLEDARQAVKQAESTLAQAKANLAQVDIRKSELVASQAAVTRSKVSRDNAKVQLESTTVVAPRDGVVVTKYLEEGTIIPPGTSTFSQGTSIVQIADVSKMYVEVNVDEADVAKVTIGQSVRVSLEAAQRKPMTGTVSRINPSAVTTGGVTQVKVRVEIQPAEGVKLMPGLNASCEFVVSEKKNVLVIPSQAVKRESGKSFVEVMVKKDQPAKREITTGAQGNTVVEVVSGLKEGDEVVVSKIDRAQIEEQQRRMEDSAQQRNPFSGGTGSGGTGNRPAGATGGGMGR